MMLGTFYRFCGVLCALFVLGCESAPRPLKVETRPVLWPARVAPGAITLGDVSGIPINLYGHHGHGHVAGWYRPGGSPLSMLAVTTRGRSDEMPEQGLSSVAMTITSEKGSEETKGRAVLEVGEHERTTAAFVQHPDKPKGVAIVLTSLNLFSEPEAKLFEQLAANQWLAVAVTPASDLAGITRLPKLTTKNTSHIGRLLDHHLAERAFAAESILDYLFMSDPALSELPLVVIGASLGALAAPATAVRLKGVDALVMIGGGADVPSIAVDSALKLVKLDPEIRAQEGRRVLEATLASMHLDPGKLGRRLQNTPRLLIEGSLDHIVPARYRHQLYTAMGQPERWRYPVACCLIERGHSGKGLEGGPLPHN